MAASFRGMARLGGLGAGATLLLTRDLATGGGSGADSAKRRPPPATGRIPAAGGGPARCDAAVGLYDESKDSAGFVGVFLDRASVDRARAELGASLTRVPHALVHLHPDSATKEMFAPLFGSKAKVLVRGVAEDLATSQKVMIVEVSVGGARNRVVPRTELGHASIPTIALASDSWDDDVADLLGVDLARRLLENGILHARGSWDGVLPAQVLDGIKYPATHATFTQVDEPIALEGTVCASTDYNTRAGECVAAGRREEAALAVKAQPQAQAEAAHGQHAHEGEEERGECPLCTYMMASPCKDVFIVFKACIDKAGDTNEAADLKECEPSAAQVHSCIHKFGLFREKEEDAEQQQAAPAPAPTAGAGGSSVQAASPSKGK